MNYLKKDQLNSLSCVSPDYLVDLYKNKLKDSTDFNPDVPKNTISHEKIENEINERMEKQPEIDNNDYTDVKDMNTIKKESFEQTLKETFNLSNLDIFNNVIVLKIIIFVLLFILFFSLLKLEIYKYKLKLLKKLKDKKKK